MSNATDYTILAPPRITPGQFRDVLSAAGSPAAPEADAMYSAALAYGVDPAIVLSIFHVESGYGRAGVATRTKSVGNIRTADGTFRSYTSYTEAAADCARLLSTSLYGKSRDYSTASTFTYRWAPSRDGNRPAAYGDRVVADVTKWLAAAGPSASAAGLLPGSWSERPEPNAGRLFDCVFASGLDLATDAGKVAWQAGDQAVSTRERLQDLSGYSGESGATSTALRTGLAKLTGWKPDVLSGSLADALRDPSRGFVVLGSGSALPAAARFGYTGAHAIYVRPTGDGRTSLVYNPLQQHGAAPVQVANEAIVAFHSAMPRQPVLTAAVAAKPAPAPAPVAVTAAPPVTRRGPSLALLLTLGGLGMLVVLVSLTRQS